MWNYYRHGNRHKMIARFPHGVRYRFEAQVAAGSRIMLVDETTGEAIFESPESSGGTVSHTFMSLGHLVAVRFDGVHGSVKAPRFTELA
jgi:hypothetical protein